MRRSDVATTDSARSRISTFMGSTSLRSGCGASTASAGLRHNRSNCTA
ncbi:MAG: hypothetical protein H0V77_07245 [Actinobacteria bacterium]|nr:hypothetical protein [Actinomycetota bacterium]